MNARKMKFLSTFTAVALVVSVLLSLAWWPGNVNAFGSGAGTAANPYIITTAEDLNQVRNTLGAYYKLGADIDLSGYTNWVPIGTSSRPFTGSIDGDGHTITGLKIARSSQSNVGLFGYVNTAGQIRDVHLVGVDVTGSNSTGGLVGYMYKGKIETSSVSGMVTGVSEVGGLAGSLYFTTSISGSSANVAVIGDSYAGGLIGRYDSTIASSDNSASGDVSGNGAVGGLMGRTSGGVINSYASGNVTGKAAGIGGLIGQATSGKIESSYATGNVTSNGGTNIGGLIGSIGSTSGRVEKSYATGNITANYGSYNYAGGLVGNSFGIIINCYATGNLIHQTEPSAVPAGFGGLVGLNDNGNVQNSYSIGNVSGGGGLAYSGRNITNSYYDMNTSGQSDTGKGIPKITADMMKLSTYSTWDFTSIWSIHEGAGYPKLRYSVAYDNNGGTAGTVPTDANSYIPGQAITVLGNTGSLARDGYAFAGWSLDPSGKGTIYAAGDSFPLAKTLNVKLYAKWTPVSTIAPIGNQTLPDLQEGYASGTQQAYTVTITRTGAGVLTNLAVHLSGADADALEITGPAATTLDSGRASTTFTVKAKDYLPKGTYSATVTVSADQMADVTFNVGLAVKKKPIVKGDGTGDGKVTLADSVLITKYMQGKITLTPEQIEALDMNGDGELTAEDADMLQALYVAKP
ncbi:GLUG motif-containing protein [Gorillibacterium sp. sgz500922]|uniref:GLUG motif-containing protein n=1 Tax=Gorillibacterium sp. sgz500922 TaxID=3446694 RepID=UPI003F66F676